MPPWTNADQEISFGVSKQLQDIASSIITLDISGIFFQTLQIPVTLKGVPHMTFEICLRTLLQF